MAVIRLSACSFFGDSHLNCSRSDIQYNPFQVSRPLRQCLHSTALLLRWISRTFKETYCESILIHDNVPHLIIGSVGLPKKFEAYWFLQINDDHVNDFRTQLNELVPLVTSTADGFRDLAKIAHHKRDSSGRHTLLKLSGVNIAFSQKGLAKVNSTTLGKT